MSFSQLKALSGSPIACTSRYSKHNSTVFLYVYMHTYIFLDGLIVRAQVEMLTVFFVLSLASLLSLTTGLSRASFSKYLF